MMKEKRRLLKDIVAFVLLICLTLGVSTTAFAANSKVSSIRIDVDNNGDTKYPTISVDSSKYSITDYGSWNKKEENLKAGDKITCTIVIEPQEGYEIRLSNGKSSIKVRGTGASLASYSRNGSKYNIKINYIVGGQLEEPEEAYWDEDEPWIARVSKVAYADEYEFQLMRNDKKVASAKTKKRSYNFAEELAKKSNAEKDGIAFRVRAICDDDDIDKSEWNYSEELDDDDWNEIWYHCKNNDIKWKESSSDSSSSSGGPGVSWNNDDVPSAGSNTPGYWFGTTGNWWFYNSDGTLAKGWIVYENRWYYINSNGKMALGWVKVGDKWYYLNNGVDSSVKEGVALTGMHKINGYTYFFYKRSGTSARGYAYSQCEMATDMTIKIDGKNYYFDSNGRMR